MSYIDIQWPDDEPAIIIATGRGEFFILADDPRRPTPDMSELGAAVLVTRLRWWADHIEGTKRARRMSEGRR